MTRKGSKKRDVVTLADLAPKRRVIGGSERRVFGVDPPGTREKKARKDLAPRHDPKGGKKSL